MQGLDSKWGSHVMVGIFTPEASGHVRLLFVQWGVTKVTIYLQILHVGLAAAEHQCRWCSQSLCRCERYNLHFRIMSVEPNLTVYSWAWQTESEMYPGLCADTLRKQHGYYFGATFWPDITFSSSLLNQTTLLFCGVLSITASQLGNIVLYTFHVFLEPTWITIQSYW